MKTKRRKSNLTGTAIVRVQLEFTPAEMMGESDPNALLASILESSTIIATLGEDIDLEVEVLQGRGVVISAHPTKPANRRSA